MDELTVAEAEWVEACHERDAASVELAVAQERYREASNVHAVKRDAYLGALRRKQAEDAANGSARSQGYEPAPPSGMARG